MMELTIIDITPETPYIMFDPWQGKLEIYGISIPENSVEFYKSLLDSLDQYITVPKSTTQVDIQMEYFNTSTSKCIFDILKRLEIIQGMGKEVIINWYYEADDEDMREAGEDYKALVNLPINILQEELNK